MNTLGSLPSVNVYSSFNSGLSTIATGAQNLQRDAQQIANPDGPDSTNSLLDLNQSSQLAQAGAAVIRASNQMLGTLLNAFA
jgi:hypothetical protein